MSEQQKKTGAEDDEPGKVGEPQVVPLSMLQAYDNALREAMSIIRNQVATNQKQVAAKKEPLLSLPTLIQLGLLGVGIVYSIFAALQWSAIQQQDAISTQQLEQTGRAYVSAPSFVQEWIFDPKTKAYDWRFRPQWQITGPPRPKTSLRIRSAKFVTGYYLRATHLVTPKARSVSEV